MPKARANGVPSPVQPIAPASHAPAAQQCRQRNGDRTHLLAGAVQGAGVRQILRCREPVQNRGEHGPHRPRIGAAVRMTADLAIHDAMVHAGAASDAAQHLAQSAAQHARPAVIHEHDVERLRSVPVPCPLRAAIECRVLCDVGACSRAHQEAQQDHRVRQRRNQLLDSGGDDMHARDGGGQLGIALVGHRADRAAISEQKLAPEMPTSASRNFCRNSRRALCTIAGTSSLFSLAW